MKGVGTDIGTIHFVGIGGIGMSGIAEVMHNLGYQVQGSDIAESYVVEGLRAKGIDVKIGHSPENVEGTAVVVTSTAVKRGNPEVEAALASRIPLVRRADARCRRYRPDCDQRRHHQPIWFQRPPRRR